MSKTTSLLHHGYLQRSRWLRLQNKYFLNERKTHSNFSHSTIFFILVTLVSCGILYNTWLSVFLLSRWTLLFEVVKSLLKTLLLLWPYGEENIGVLVLFSKFANRWIQLVMVYVSSPLGRLHKLRFFTAFSLYHIPSSILPVILEVSVVVLNSLIVR